MFHKIITKNPLLFIFGHLVYLANMYLANMYVSNFYLFNMYLNNMYLANMYLVHVSVPTYISMEVCVKERGGYQ